MIIVIVDTLIVYFSHFVTLFFHVLIFVSLHPDSLLRLWCYIYLLISQNSMERGMSVR